MKIWYYSESRFFTETHNHRLEEFEVVGYMSNSRVDYMENNARPMDNVLTTNQQTKLQNQTSFFLQIYCSLQYCSSVLIFKIKWYFFTFWKDLSDLGSYICLCPYLCVWHRHAGICRGQKRATYTMELEILESVTSEELRSFAAAVHGLNHQPISTFSYCFEFKVKLLFLIYHL